MRKTLPLYFFCFLIMSYAAHAQSPSKRDSLLKLLPEKKDDTTKVLLLIDLAQANKNNDITAAYKYCADALTLSEKLQYNKGKFQALLSEIALIRIEGKDSLALEKSKNLVKFAEEKKELPDIGRSYLMIGEVYDNNGDNSKGIEYALKGLEIAERLNKKELLQNAYSTLQRLYFSRSEFDKAIQYGTKAIEIAKELNDKEKIITQSYNLAYTYNLLKNFDKSIAVSNEVIQLAREVGNQRVESYALYNLCSIFLRTDKLSEALSYGQQCLQIARKTSDKSIESNVLAALGSINLQLGKNKDAESYLLQALDIRTKTEDKQGIADIKNILANVYFALGDPKKAYTLEKESEDFSDAYQQSILKEQSSELEKKYETEKKEAQIKLQQTQLKQRSILNYVLIGGSAALLFIFLLTYRNYRNRQKLQQAKIVELETERQLTATEAVLKGEEQERTRLAKDLHDGLGGMLSGIKYSLNSVKGNLIMTPDNARAFERSIDMLDSSIKEMRRVAHNMMPEILVKYGLDTALKEFCNEIDHSGVVHASYLSIGMDDTEIVQTTAVTIYRIVQELVNNVIKHAAAKNVLVQAHLSGQEKVLAITVEDDGKGFDTATLDRSGGIGWKNIQNRVEFLKGKLDVQSTPGKGTSIMIEITI